MDALLTLSSKGQLVIPARELIGCSGYAGPLVSLERHRQGVDFADALHLRAAPP